MTKRVLCAATVAALLLGACGGDDDATSSDTTAAETTTSSVPTDAPAEKSATTVYFLDADAHLAAGGRLVDGAQDAVRALLAGPIEIETGIGYSSAIPAGTELLGLTVTDGVATADFSGTFDDGGGSASMLGRVAQVVYTLTVFDAIDRVKFSLDGVPVDTLGGEGVVVGPDGVDRSAFDAVLPPILVEIPQPGLRVTSPIIVAGISNTFEATVNWEVTDPDGVVVAEGFVNGGTLGTWSPFSGSIEYTTDRLGMGALVMFEVSAEDGSRTNLIEIPIEFT